jgi:hypothetical protein
MAPSSSKARVISVIGDDQNIKEYEKHQEYRMIMRLDYFFA